MRDPERLLFKRMLQYVASFNESSSKPVEHVKPFR